ncbi:hypothetical protein BH09MYX1_BH09MYX1_37300 [soil metagenome]
MKRLALGLALALTLTACTGTKDEVRGLSTAVDAYRKAENEKKPELADALDKFPCTDPEVCEAKAACTKSANETAKGLRLQKDLAKRLEDVKAGKILPGSPEALKISIDMTDDDQLLADGMKDLDECDNRLIKLRVKYNLTASATP